MKTAQDMVVEMSKSGLTDQAIANLAALDQGHVTRIRRGDRRNVWPKTYGAINDAYLLWKSRAASRPARSGTT